MKQPSLKAQDIVVATKLATRRSVAFTYAQIAQELAMAQSGVHASVRILVTSKLISKKTGDGIQVNRPRLIDLLIYGVPSFFPAVIGAITSGMPTASAASDIARLLADSPDEKYVWADPDGKSRGSSLVPLHPCLIQACRVDDSLYKVMMAVDSLRVGSARERELASDLIRRELS
jgi:hypothetical protein